MWWTREAHLSETSISLLLFRNVGPARWPDGGRLGERGGLLLEAVVSITLFTIVGTAVLSGLSTAHISSARFESQSVAENLARNQMEHLFSLPYEPPPSSYPGVATPQGYTVTATVVEYVPGDPLIEKVVVEVLQGGRSVLVLETLRTREEAVVP